jgi:aminoglycoside 3-N-acetyltransferase
MGIFSEYVRIHHDSVRSIDPNFSVAAIGPRAPELTSNPPSHSFGLNSFWERFLAAQGKFCNFNFDAASTFLHYVERCLDVPYRWDKPFSGTILRGETEERRVFYHYVRDLENEAYAPNFSAFDERAEKMGVVQRSNLGRGQIVCVSAQDSYEVVESGYLDNKSFLINGTAEF